MSIDKKPEDIRVVRGVPMGEISAADHRLQFLYDVMGSMRDGTLLAADIILPEGDGPFPVVLTRTPYDKSALRKSSDMEDFARRGYALVVQDVRGRFNSEGKFDPYRQENNDGNDTVEWVARQQWCDGNIGMIGGSYAGQTQWYSAAQAPQALKAIVPRVSPPGHPFLNEPFYGGIMIMAMAEWMMTMGPRSFHASMMSDILTEYKDYFETTPISNLGEVLGYYCPWWEEEWLNHPLYDEFWRSCGYEQFWTDMRVPALNITGWWDMNFIGAPRNFVGMNEHSATREARISQRLVIGPWGHSVNRSRSLSGVDFGPDAITGLNGYVLKFFDRWLKGKTTNKLDDDKRVHVFILGANQWWEADAWPLPGTAKTNLFLHSDGCANSHSGDGSVSFVPPESEPTDKYISDPKDPVRFPWSLRDGPVDDRAASARGDVLCYTSNVLNMPLDVVGDVTAVLYVSSSAKDCDFHVRLIDVCPNGSTRFLCHGALRARFREGFDKMTFLTPGEVTRLEVNMTAVGIRFLPGHRIRIEISSSWFPRFERNSQTGAENWMRDEEDPLIAVQNVFHNNEHPSHIVLPLIKNGPK